MSRTKPLLLFKPIPTCDHDKTWSSVAETAGSWDNTVLMHRSLVSSSQSVSATECKYIFNIKKWAWSRKITGGKKIASKVPDNILSLCVSFYYCLCNQKGLTTGLVIPVKLSTFAFAELGVKCEVLKILKRHRVFKASLHLTTFNLIIIHITYSTFSLEGEALVPQDSAIRFELISTSFRAHSEQSET